MSWDSFIDNLVANSNDASGNPHVDKACIIGLDGGAPWTTPGHPKNLFIQPQQAQLISTCLKSKDFTQFQSNGIHLGDVKYQFLRSIEGKIVLARKKGNGSLTIQSTKKAIVIAHCPEGCQHGNCNKAVSVIADYLETLNF